MKALLVSILVASICLGQSVSPPSNGGSVTSIQVSGTANQITATSCGPSTTTLACLLSIPSDFRLPGTINLLTLTQPATAATLTLANTSTLATAGQGLLSGTYTSGITATGTIGQTCALTSFNNGNTGGTATVALTGVNTIAGGTALVITAAGSGNTSASTSSTAGNGTATCSGTAVVATVLTGFSSTFTFTGATGVTFPTSGTLATTTSTDFVKGAANLTTTGAIPFQNGTTGTVTQSAGFTLSDAANVRQMLLTDGSSQSGTPIVKISSNVNGVGFWNPIVALNSTNNQLNYMYIGQSLAAGRTGALAFQDNTDGVSGYMSLSVFGGNPGIAVFKNGTASLGPGNTASNGTVSIKDPTATTGATRLNIFKGAADSTSTNTLVSDASASFVNMTASGLYRFNGSNSTAAVAGLIGTTCPAVTCTAAYTWVQVTTSDGSTGYIPVWK